MAHREELRDRRPGLRHRPGERCFLLTQRMEIGSQDVERIELRKTASVTIKRQFGLR